MQFLIIQTAFIGDVILATSVVEKLKMQFPDAKIDFLLKKGNESLLLNHPHISNVWVFDKKNGKIKNLIHLIGKIRKQKYDHVINIHRSLTSGLMTVLSGAKIKTGFDKNPLSFLYSNSITHVLTKEEKNTHEIKRNNSLICKITDNNVLRPKLYPSKTDYDLVKDEREYVCFAPSSIWFTKRLPTNKWVELLDKMSEKYIVKLIGGPDDISLCEEIKNKSKNKNIEILAGKLTFLQSAALIHKAKITFSNDSAPMHFASAMNAPVAAIFCSTVPEFGFGPLSDVSYIIQSDEMPSCKPCGIHGKTTCPKKHFKCADINIDRLLKRISF